MHMGFLLRQYRWPLATRVVSEKGSRVARPQREKVPTRGFSAKKEGVWRDLGTKGADSRIFGEKGNGVARPPCHFPQLGEKGRSVAQTQQRKVPTRGFSAKKEVVWRDLPAIFHNLAKKEGGWRNLSREKCRLADFRRKRKPCGATSKICQIFFISLCTSTD